jgi:two-component system response regulator ChvI
MLAFERGALDFINKSRGVPVIFKRLRMIAGPGRRGQRVEAEPERLVCQGRLTLRPTVSRALWDGKDVDLTVTEYRIVELLAGQAGRFFSYRRVYDRMHYEGFLAGCGDDEYRVNVRSAMKRIRNKFRVHTPGLRRDREPSRPRLPLPAAGLTTGAESTHLPRPGSRGTQKFVSGHNAR